MTDQLPPWDEIPYFQPVRETTFTQGGAPAPLQVADANPMRVALIFGVPGGGATVQVSTNPAVTGTLGLNIANSQFPFTLLQKDVGPLVSAAWYMIGTAGAKITVIEVLLSRWQT